MKKFRSGAGFNSEKDIAVEIRKKTSKIHSDTEWVSQIQYKNR